MPNLGSIGLSFPADPMAIALGLRVPFPRSSGSAAGRSGKPRSNVRDLKTAPALRLLHQIGGTGNEDRRIDETTGGDTQSRRLFEAGTGFKKNNVVGGQRKSLKSPNSGKESEGI
jgi:hypothetical protein